MTLRVEEMLYIDDGDKYGDGFMEDIWNFYYERFVDIDANSVQAHLMEYSDFEAMFNNPLITKYVCFSNDKIVGLSVMTNYLGEWPLYSARYFAKHFKEVHDRGAVWIVGFVCASMAGAFVSLVRAMLYPVEDSKGMVVMDWSKWNMDNKKLDHATRMVLTKMNDKTVMHHLDAQTFTAYRFDGVNF